MSAPIDPVMFRQLSLIEQIIRDETWLEGERRGYPVSSDNPAVREAVCQIVLRIGADMRTRCRNELRGNIHLAA